MTVIYYYIYSKKERPPLWETLFSLSRGRVLLNHRRHFIARLGNGLADIGEIKDNNAEEEKGNHGQDGEAGAVGLVLGEGHHQRPQP